VRRAKQISLITFSNSPALRSLLLARIGMIRL
jgi:hypothetical protein